MRRRRPRRRNPGRIRPPVPNLGNWILIRVTALDVLIPDYLYYVFESAWSRGQLAELAHGTQQQCIRVSDIARIPFVVGPEHLVDQRGQPLRRTVQLRELATVRIAKRAHLRHGDILLRRCSDTRHAGEPFLLYLE